MRRNASHETDTVETSTAFDLLVYAREHRCRVRNLHDGRACPPARWMKPKGTAPTAQVGHVGQDDRFDVIAGHDGYVCEQGAPGWLGIYLSYRSARGVNRASGRIRGMGGRVEQVGDFEVAGVVPVEAIEDALRLIRVSKLSPGRPGGNPGLRRLSQASEAYTS